MATKTKRKLTTRQMAVAVAKDVLANIDAYKFARGVYCQSPHKPSDELRSATARGDDLQDFVREVKEKCHVCALGACLISKAKLFDGVPLNMVASDSCFHGRFPHENLETVLGKRSIGLIESAFEGSLALATRHGCSELSAIKAACFGDNIRSRGGHHSDVVAAVMKNIIKNKGVFKP